MLVTVRWWLSSLCVFLPSEIECGLWKQETSLCVLLPSEIEFGLWKQVKILMLPLQGQYEIGTVSTS